MKGDDLGHPPGSLGTATLMFLRPLVSLLPHTDDLAAMRRGPRQDLLDLPDREMLAGDRGEIREAARHLPERVGDDVSDEAERESASRGHPRYRSLRHPDGCLPSGDRPAPS